MMPFIRGRGADDASCPHHVYYKNSKSENIIHLPMEPDISDVNLLIGALPFFASVFSCCERS